MPVLIQFIEATQPKQWERYKNIYGEQAEHQLYQLFPSCFTEAQDVITGKMRRVVDWGKLRELLGEYVENGEPEWRVRVHDIYKC